MDAPTSKARRRWGGRALIGGLLLVAAALGWLAWRSAQEQRLEGAVAEARALVQARGLDQRPLAAAGPDARALAVDSAARPLGYSLRMDPGTPPISRAPAGGLPHGQGLREYLERAADDASARARAPGGVWLGQWLRVNGAEIDALVDVVESGPNPLWLGDWDSLPADYQMPERGGWSGQLLIGRILTAAALDSSARGEHDEAERRLVAAWRLRESFDAEPTLLSRLIARTLLTDQLAVLRKLERPGPAWEERLARLRPVERMLDVLVLDALRQAGLHGGSGEWPSVLPPDAPKRARALAWATNSNTGRRMGLRALSEPLRLGARGSEVRWFVEQVRAAESAGPCPPDLDALAGRLEPERDALRWLSQDPHVFLLVRAYEARVLTDLTRATLAMRRGELADGDTVSGTCPRWRWRVVVAASGGRELQFDGPRPGWTTNQLGTLDWALPP